jgi:membrane protein
VGAVSRWGRQLLRASRLAASGYGRHATSQLAAAIAYRVLFSIVPLVTLVVAILDLVLPSTTRENFVGWLADVIPGEEVDASVERSLRASGQSATFVGLIALGALLWSASGMMASLRSALRIIWNAERGRPFVGGKLLDLALVLAAGLLLLFAFGLSVVVQVLVGIGEDLSEAAGWHGEGKLLGGAGQVTAAVGVSFVALLLLYRVLAPERVRVANLWTGALVGAVALQVAMAGFTVYLARFADFSAVYGSLGAVFGFLLLVYLAALVLLVGAEIAAAWPAAREA